MTVEFALQYLVGRNLLIHQFRSVHPKKLHCGKMHLLKLQSTKKSQLEFKVSTHLGAKLHKLKEFLN